MFIIRDIYNKIKEKSFRGKIILLVGARQVGKTTMLKQLQKDLGVPSIWLNADEADIYNDILNADTSTRLLQVIGKENKLAVIDEAHQIPNIGKKLKLFVDTYPDIQIIATGSSAFDLLDNTNEPLTGRKSELIIYPISFKELVNTTSLIEEKRSLPHRLIYGSYPEVLNNRGNEKEVLIELANSYLYKDILKIDGIRKASVIQKLLQALAFQIGSEVRYHELARTVGNIDPTTVEKYLDILEKAYVIFKLPAFNRNMRTEIKKGKKYYFYDNGVRNVLTNNFSAIEMRQDIGAIWENYIISERLKKNSYASEIVMTYYWRTNDQAEIDYIEEKDGILNAFEIKWKQQNSRFPQSFIQSYPEHTTKVIHRENYDQFLSD